MSIVSFCFFVINMINGKYSPSDIRVVLSVSFTAVGGRLIDYGYIEQPFFYEASHALVFPPVSDLETSRNLESISQTLAVAVHLLKKKPYLGKALIFPVAEEHGVASRLGFDWGFYPRNHWVTLHYEPATEIATLIDSRPSNVSCFYSTTAMKNLLTAGLKPFNYVIKEFNVKYQSVQLDDIHCGAWTAINIEALANGVSVDDHLSALSVQDKNGVVRHNLDKINRKINAGIYQPVSSINRSDSSKTLSTEGSTSTASLSDADEDEQATPFESPINSPITDAWELWDNGSEVEVSHDDALVVSTVIERVENNELCAVRDTGVQRNVPQLLIQFKNKTGFYEQMHVDLNRFNLSKSNARVMFNNVALYVRSQIASGSQVFILPTISALPTELLLYNAQTPVKDRARNNFRFWRKAEYQLDAFGAEKSAGVPRSIEHFFRSERVKMEFRFDARNGSYSWRDPKRLLNNVTHNHNMNFVSSVIPVVCSIVGPRLNLRMRCSLGLGPVSLTKPREFRKSLNFPLTRVNGFKLYQSIDDQNLQIGKMSLASIMPACPFLTTKIMTELSLERDVFTECITSSKIKQTDVSFPHHRVTQLVRRIHESRSGIGSLDPADKPRDVGNLSLPDDVDKTQTAPIFFMQVMCSDMMTVAGIALLTVGFIACCLGMTAVAILVAVAGLVAIGLSATGYTEGYSRFFMQKEHPGRSNIVGDPDMTYSMGCGAP